MPRPKSSSYRSYNLIYNALATGPKYFEQIKAVTKLHRNTVASRLRFLESQGLVRKERKGNRVYYEVIKDPNWEKYLVDKKLIRYFKRSLKRLAREHVRNNELRAGVMRGISQFYEELDKLVELQESQEILDLIPNWQRVPISKIYNLLYLDKYIVYLNSHRLICPHCLHFGTITEHESNEVICPKCGLVIEDEIISPEQRLKLILKFMKG